MPQQMESYVAVLYYSSVFEISSSAGAQLPPSAFVVQPWSCVVSFVKLYMKPIKKSFDTAVNESTRVKRHHLPSFTSKRQTGFGFPKDMAPCARSASDRCLIYICPLTCIVSTTDCMCSVWRVIIFGGCRLCYDGVANVTLGWMFP